MPLKSSNFSSAFCRDRILFILISVIQVGPTLRRAALARDLIRACQESFKRIPDMPARLAGALCSLRAPGSGTGMTLKVYIQILEDCLLRCMALRQKMKKLALSGLFMQNIKQKFPFKK